MGGAGSYISRALKENIEVEHLKKVPFERQLRGMLQEAISFKMRPKNPHIINNEALGCSGRPLGQQAAPRTPKGSFEYCDFVILWSHLIDFGCHCNSGRPPTPFYDGR